MHFSAKFLSTDLQSSYQKLFIPSLLFSFPLSRVETCVAVFAVSQAEAPGDQYLHNSAQSLIISSISYTTLHTVSHYILYTTPVSHSLTVSHYILLTAPPGLS